MSVPVRFEYDGCYIGSSTKRRMRIISFEALALRRLALKVPGHPVRHERQEIHLRIKSPHGKSRMVGEMHLEQAMQLYQTLGHAIMDALPSAGIPKRKKSEPNT